MADEILNRVAQSKLITFNLEDYYPEGERILVDIKDWLHEGLVLREKEFRGYVEGHSWEDYQDAYVAVHCSTDAIIPAWAYMLITTRLQPYVRKVVAGSLEDLETALFQIILESLDSSFYIGESVIIKGCSKKPVPLNAYILAAAKLGAVAKNIMYGEACSFVPLSRKK